EQMMRDEANFERISAITAPQWEEQRPALLKAYADVYDLNRRTAAQLIQMLAAPASEQLRDAFMRKAYQEICSVTWASDLFRRALDRSDLTDEQRQAIQTQFDQQEPAIDQLTAEAMDMVDEYRQHYAIYSRDAAYAQSSKEHDIAVAALDERSSDLYKAASK